LKPPPQVLFDIGLNPVEAHAKYLLSTSAKEGNPFYARRKKGTLDELV
jgi:hypothetical protein